MKLLALVLVASCGAPAPKLEPFEKPKVTRDGTKPPPPPPVEPTLGPEREYMQLAETAAARMVAIAQVLSTARECGVVTADLNALGPRFAGTTAAIERVRAAGRIRVLGYALEKQTGVEEAARTIIDSPTVAACSNDPQFVIALDGAWAL